MVRDNVRLSSIYKRISKGTGVDFSSTPLMSFQKQFDYGTNGTIPGLMMDIDRYVTMVAAKDASSTVGYVRQNGMRLSAYEHLIPEKIFADPNDPNPPQGISAVKALAVAASQGQKIYTLNQANQANHATLLAQIAIDPQTRIEIQNALAAGKEVTVHQAPITLSGWTGSGYIITDPGTGAGAYKISGGANGAFYLALYIAVIATLVALLISLSGVGVLVGAIASAPFLALSYVFQNYILKLDSQGQFLISYVELAIVFTAAFLAPELFLVDIAWEIGLYINNLP